MDCNELISYLSFILPILLILIVDDVATSHGNRVGPCQYMINQNFLLWAYIGAHPKVGR